MTKKVPPTFWHLDNKKRRPTPRWKLELEQYRRRNKGKKI